MMTEKAKSQEVLLAKYEEQEEQYYVMMANVEHYRNDLLITRSVMTNYFMTYFNVWLSAG